MDMRDLAAVQACAVWLGRTHPHLDILINNACQTLRRPPAFYRHLIAAELQSAAGLAPQVRNRLIN